jgi:hypothetical protein
MAVCVPKHLICSTFVPAYVTVSTINLSVTNETRSRLVTGNNFWRSIDAGVGENSIEVESVWLDAGSGVTSVSADVRTVRLTITEDSTTEIYGASQLRGAGSDWSVNAGPALASQITVSSILVEMNQNDNPQPWPASPVLDPFVDEFASTALSGGTGPPLTGSTIQTGPYRALVFVQFSEAGVANGSQVEVRLIQEWRNVVGGSTLEFGWETFSEALGSTCFDSASVSADFCDTGL